MVAFLCLCAKAMPPKKKTPVNHYVVAPASNVLPTSFFQIDPPKAKDPNPALEPADKIYHKLLWYDVFDANDFDLGYEDRFKGIMFMPILKFRHTDDETSEVPFHRVHLYRYQGQIVWDRDKRVNLVDKLAAYLLSQRTEQSANAAQNEILMSHVPLFPSILGQKLSVHTPETTMKRTDESRGLKVSTINVLFDQFVGEAAMTSQRIPLLCRELEEQDADFVFLQEVSRDVAQKLRRSSDTLRKYFWTDVPSDVNSSQCILSKFPIVECVSHAISQKKRVIYAVAAPVQGGPFDQPIVLVNPHLVSDYAADAIARRLEELDSIRRNVRSFAHVVVAGDFNFGDQSVEQVDRSTIWMEGFEDCWLIAQNQTCCDPQEVVEPGQVPKKLTTIGGFTFDPTRNDLARLGAKFHLYPRRLDRILVRGMSVVGCKTFAEKPHSVRLENGAVIPLYPSDHFGVSATMLVASEVASPKQSNAASAVASSSAEAFSMPISVKPFPPFFRSALCFIPPHEYWPAINRWRDKHDKAVERWMPHINLMFPFVTPERFTDAISVIESALRSPFAARMQIQPFKVQLRQTCTFDSKKAVIFLKPETAGDEFAHIYRLLAPLFPQCGRKSNAEGLEDASHGAVNEVDSGSYTPHLTLGQCGRGKQLTELLSAIDAAWKPTEFTVTHIHLIAHLDNTPAHQIIHSFALPESTTNDSAEATAVAAPKHGKPPRMVMEPSAFGCRPIPEYTPQDSLEQWCHSVSDPVLAKGAPSHISQLGGMYHIPSTELIAFLTKWHETIVNGQPFYLEEIRGSVFRLYVDLDLVRTSEVPLAIQDSHALCRIVVAFARKFFPESADCEAMVFSCQGPWDDSHATNTHCAGTAKSKSGFRIYFQKIYVNPLTYSAFLRGLQEFFELASEKPSLASLSARSDVTWKEVVDSHGIEWDRARLIGSIKRRRNLQRVYTAFAAIAGDGTLDEALLCARKLNPLQLLFSSTVRLWEEDMAIAQGIVCGNGFVPTRILDKR